MKVRSGGEHVLDILFPLALLMVFAASAVLAVLLAANVYGKIAVQSAETYTARTVTAYLTEKVHRGDGADRVYLGVFQGRQALVTEKQAGDQVYCTYVYFRDGALRELMVKKGSVISPQTGREVLKIRDLQMEQIQDNLLKFQCTDENDRVSVAYAALRSLEE